jgi:hypothetical protein
MLAITRQPSVTISGSATCVYLDVFKKNGTTAVSFIAFSATARMSR